MFTAALLSSGRVPEQLLLSLDASMYCAFATVVAKFAGDDAFGAVIIYLAFCVAMSTSRHVAAQRAPCNQDASPEGHLCNFPAALRVEDAALTHLAPWVYIPPVALVVVALLSFAAASPTGTIVAPVAALVAAEVHFVRLRVHGDCRGGKPAVTLFVLLLHAVAALGGSPPPVTLSLHRLLIVSTYFLTGLRKLYCVGPKWCDGKNLQTILRVQALYHDVGASSSPGLNLLLAQSRALCCVASVLVVALQMLVLPLCLVVPHPAALPVGFGLAMSFHAANLILWRINFFVG